MHGRIGAETIMIRAQNVFLCCSDISSTSFSSPLFGYKEYVIMRATNTKNDLHLDE